MRILVVEDDREVGAYLRKGLTESGHVVALAEAGREGLDRAASESFDALVIDRMLPGLDGLAIVAALRAAKNQTPILVLSALGDVEDRVIVDGGPGSGEFINTLPPAAALGVNQTAARMLSQMEFFCGLAMKVADCTGITGFLHVQEKLGEMLSQLEIARGVFYGAEAMAMELPVVTTRVMGIPELVEHERSGLLVAPGRADAVADALRRLAADPDERRRLGAVGRRTVEQRFDCRREAAKLATLLAGVAGAAGDRPRRASAPAGSASSP